MASYYGWFKNTDSFGLVMNNGFDKTFKQAKRHVSAVERKKYELSDGIGNAACGCAD